MSEGPRRKSVVLPQGTGPGVEARIEQLKAELDEALARAERAEMALRDYADHQSWRCGYPDRYPWDPDCPCGLMATLRDLCIDRSNAEARATTDG